MYIPPKRAKKAPKMVKNGNKFQKITNNCKISEITKYGEKITKIYKIDKNLQKCQTEPKTAKKCQN